MRLVPDPCAPLAAFVPYGAVHGVAVLLSLAGWAALLAWARAAERRRGARGARAFRRGFGLCVAAFNLACVVRLLLPDVFDWGHSLPLHLCDLAWGAAVLSLLSGGPPSLARHQAPVIWGLSLSLLAYATPAVTADPDGVSFWTFWISHWQILGAALLNVARLGTRITAHGRRVTLLLTLGGCAVATLVNLALDTNYFFTGRAAPDNPTPVDWFGPWPLRILWIALAGAGALWLVATLLMRWGPATRRGSLAARPPGVGPTR